jgi:DNA-binding winged helix-turn-helix (wHTH) protein/tetratricopeptide (TPR) repeat protein
MNEHIRGRREEFHFNNCVIRSDTRELLRDGVVQKVERRAFDLILYLLRLEGRVASKDELLEHVWGNKYVSDSVIAQSIMKARKAMGISGKEPGPIKTIHRVGYRFVGDVRQVACPAGHGEAREPLCARARILWLPTECEQTPPDLSWVRYGLISVATQLLQSHGVGIVSVGESIHLYESSPMERTVEALSLQLRTPGTELGVVSSRLVPVGGEYRLEWQMHLDGTRSANSVTGRSPAEMALMAAQDVSMRARLHALQLAPATPDASFWKELENLIALAESLHLTEQLAPLLAPSVAHAHCPARALAEFLWIQAQRADPQAPALAAALTERARRTEEDEYAGWAELCLALYHLHALQPDRARQHALQALPVVRRHAIGPFRPRALLLASHILASLHLEEEAGALLCEADQLIAQNPVSHMVCAAQRQRCELAHLDRQGAAPAPLLASALASARHMGYQAPAAWLEIYCGLQCCAAGDFDQCHQHLHAALVASEQGGATLAHIHAVLQMGSFMARTEDQGGLEQCLVRLAHARLRDAPLGVAAWRWLRARHLMLTGRPHEALPLAEHAMHELADLGIWWSEDNWLFVVQVALTSGNRTAAQHLVARLQARQQRRPHALLRATALATQGMLCSFDGEPAPALHLFEQAHELARHAVLAHVLLFGLVWLALVNGRRPTPSQLSGCGHWCDRTQAGRHVRAAALRAFQWQAERRQREPALAWGTGTDHAVPMVSEAAEPPAHPAHTACLPMPV